MNKIKIKKKKRKTVVVVVGKQGGRKERRKEGRKEVLGTKDPTHPWCELPLPRRNKH
jgi:hypothetical protein